MDICEENLTVAAASGDRDALSALLSQHDAALRERLTGSIGPAYRSAIEPEDVLQVTYIEAFLNIRDFSPDGRGAFLAWLLRIAQNNVRDAVRWLEREKREPRRKKVDRPHGSDSYVGLLANLVGTGTTPSSHAARDELKTALDEAIAKLPELYRTVVTMIDLENRDANQVAVAFGRSRPAVYMLRVRAHEHLAKLLGDSTRFFR